MSHPLPAVRLAYHPEGSRTLAEMKTDGPHVRLALGCNENRATREAMVDPKAEGPTVRLAAAIDSESPNQGTAKRLVEACGDPSDRPALLVSYVYLAPFLKNRHRYHYRDWVMDSGAFSAHNSGKEIKLQEYIDCCKRMMATDPTLTEMFALDVIGDWKSSLKNTEEMWRQGVPVIPTYHPGEPDSVLKGIAKDYPKIALGGVVGWVKKRKEAFVTECFARAWPCKIHGLGMSSEDMVLKFPFHSVDATNWEIGPCKFGRWQSFGQMSVLGSKQNLRSEVEWYLALERKARHRWRKDIARLDAMLANVALKPAVQVTLQPVSQSPKATELCYRTCLERGWRLSIQIHKYLEKP